MRPTSGSTKVGNDGGAVFWVGTNYDLLIESARVPGVPESGYPDSGCSAEIYTNPNPTPYIEMEILAPLANLSTTNVNYTAANTVYSLLPRTQLHARRRSGKQVSLSSKTASVIKPSAVLSPAAFAPSLLSPDSRTGGNLPCC